MKIGTMVQQSWGFRAFIPERFPADDLCFSPELLQKANRATRLIGKLDGITEILPDIDFFLMMYIRKDASSSSQIEGTRATMADAIEATTAKSSHNLPADVDDILHYISALQYAIERLRDFPMSLRVIKEIHAELMQGARTSHYASPGNFRNSQNWIGGTAPGNAEFVPPPVHEMHAALDDLEAFFHKNDTLDPIIKAWLIHAQFETIHPFLDGNGRTWRILITLFFYLEKILDKPVLFLSSYLYRHRHVYYDRLSSYHNNDIEKWLDFFIDGIIDTAEKAIETVKAIHALKEEDMRKIHSLWKSIAEISMTILMELYKNPIINVANIEEITWFTRQGSQNVIDRFIKLWILEQRDRWEKYGRSYIYRKYYDIFSDER